MMSLRQTTTNAPTALRCALAVGGASGVAVPALCAVGSRGSLTASSGQRTAAFDDFHYACALSDGLAPRLAAAGAPRHAPAPTGASIAGRGLPSEDRRAGVQTTGRAQSVRGGHRCGAVSAADLRAPGGFPGARVRLAAPRVTGKTPFGGHLVPTATARWPPLTPPAVPPPLCGGRRPEP